LFLISPFFNDFLTLPIPQLYAAKARFQSFSSLCKYLRYLIAVLVDLITFFRSSLSILFISPHSLAVGGINCQRPKASLGDFACGLFPLSINGITARSIGRFS